jgi:hypothetical protein
MKMAADVNRRAEEERLRRLQLQVGEHIFKLNTMKKCVVLQVNDAAVRISLFVFVCKVQGGTDYRTDWMGEGERKGVPPL